jgi:hypothetical protein
MQGVAKVGAVSAVTVYLSLPFVLSLFEIVQCETAGSFSAPVLPMPRR